MKLLIKRSSKSRIGYLMATVLAAVFTIAALPASAANYRWTGGGVNPTWSTLANWEVQSGSTWSASAVAPGVGDVVTFGNASADAPQEVSLDADVVIATLIMDATGDRNYRVTSPQDGAGEELYTFTMTAQQYPLEQTKATTCSLTFQVKIDFAYVATGNFFVQLLSTSHAHVITERQVGLTLGKSSSVFYLRGTASTAPGPARPGGILEARAPVVLPRIFIYMGGVLLLNPEVEGDAVTTSFFALQSEGSLWLRRSAAIKGPLGFSYRGYIAAYDAGDEAVTLTFSGAAYRGGDIDVGPGLLGSTGRFTLSVSGIEVGGNTPPPNLTLASDTALDLRGSQALPFHLDHPPAVQGAGMLIKAFDATTQDIGASNAYTGGTYVKQGTLRLIGGTRPVDQAASSSTGETAYVEGQIGPGLLSVDPGATFSLNGIDQTISALHGAGTIQLAGGTLTATNGVSPGTNSVGTLTVAGTGDLHVSGSASQFEFTVDTSVFDRVLFSDAANLELGGVLEIVAPEGFSDYGSGQYTLFDLNGGSVSGMFSKIVPPSNMLAEVDSSSGDVVLSLRLSGSLLSIR